jgi:hypothetical protein
VARPWPGGEKRISGRASHPEEGEAMASLLLPCVATRVSLRAMWCLSGATPRGQPWPSAVTLPPRRNGLSVRRMTALWTFHASVVFQKWRWPFLYWPSKGIAVDKQANDDVVHLYRF